MAVYREGYHALEQYRKLESQIYNDACDAGVPVKSGDKNYNIFKQLAEWYGEKETRRMNGDSIEIKVQLIDEWAVSDERKTMKQATENFRLTYTRHKRNMHPSLIKKGMDGFFSIDRI